MTFDEWHYDYAKRYEERGIDDVPPVADMQAAWNAAVEACAVLADGQLDKWEEQDAYHTRIEIASSIRALSTAKVEAAKAD